MEEEVAKLALVMITTGFLAGGFVVFILERILKH